mmetsp:Transcript_75530/g.179424  ORF Transcript_75530/g.179424 Transcript_75530/m.179424 type:complete len:276 (+) Transcript_75530:66-893(+)
MDVTDTDLQAKMAERSLLWRDPPRDMDGPAPTDKRTRSHQAVMKQCSNSKVPGYSGFLPSAHAEDIYGCTQATATRVAAQEQAHRRAQLEEQERLRRERQGGATAAGKASGVVIPDDHPLGKSRSNIVRNHWVPTIPGYSGYVPGKAAENVIGGGITAACRLAGRAIAEREKTNLLPDSAPSVSLQDNVRQSYIKEFAEEEVERTAVAIRQRKENKIPGYQGHIPRKVGDSIFGANFAAINDISAELCEDRLRNPHDHFSRVCMPQFPPPKKLRD